MRLYSRLNWEGLCNRLGTRRLRHWLRRPSSGCQLQRDRVDLPGHGRSVTSPSGWSFAYAANVVADLIVMLSASPVHLIGISFGGMVAQVTALTRPEIIRSLTLIGTASSLGSALNLHNECIGLLAQLRPNCFNASARTNPWTDPSSSDSPFPSGLFLPLQKDYSFFEELGGLLKT